MASPSARSLLPRLLVAGGATLQLMTLALLLYAGQQREAAQARLDAQWADVNAKAAQSKQPKLPPSKPGPAPLPLVPQILTVAAVGSVMLIGGARLWAQEIKSRQRPTATPRGPMG